MESCARYVQKFRRIGAKRILQQFDLSQNHFRLYDSRRRSDWNWKRRSFYLRVRIKIPLSKMTECSEAKSAKLRFAQKLKFERFDAKLWFALLASLC